MSLPDAARTEGGVEDSAVGDASTPDARADAKTPDASAPKELILENSAPSCIAGFAGPEVGEDGFIAAARLTPPEYPYTVTEVEYQLAQNANCSSAAAHDVVVFKGGTTPPVSPTFLVDVPGGAGKNVGTRRQYVHPLTSPVILSAGEHLWVGVRMTQATNTSACPTSCTAGFQENTNFWSNKKTAPFSWATMESFGAGFRANFLFFAEGTIRAVSASTSSCLPSNANACRGLHSCCSGSCICAGANCGCP